MTTLDNMNCGKFKFQITVRRRSKQEAPQGVYGAVKPEAKGGS